MSEFCLFKRSAANYWQFIAGGAELNETPSDAARREAMEEAGIVVGSELIALDSICCVPANNFREWKQWPAGTWVVKEYSFGVNVSGAAIKISNEHTECKWLTAEGAMSLLKWDSNKTALWELSQRLLSPEQ